MPAATPRFYFQPLCQHEVLRVISTLNAGSLCSRHVNYGTEYPEVQLLINYAYLWLSQCAKESPSPPRHK